MTDDKKEKKPAEKAETKKDAPKKDASKDAPKKQSKAPAAKTADKKPAVKKAAPKKDAKKTDTQPETVGLTDLRPAEGAVRPRLRKGRGISTGAGKTCNRGHRGEGQRSGRSRKRGFEGGQMPGFRRIPKIRRFTPPSQLQWLVLNVGDLEKVAKSDAITYDALREQGLLNDKLAGLRVLGNGELKKKLKISAHHVSDGARKKIEAAGGTIDIVTPPAPRLKENGKKAPKPPREKVAAKAN